MKKKFHLYIDWKRQLGTSRFEFKELVHLQLVKFINTTLEVDYQD